MVAKLFFGLLGGIFRPFLVGFPGAVIADATKIDWPAPVGAGIGQIIVSAVLQLLQVVKRPQ